MTTAERNAAHWQRILAGSLSASQRKQAEAELRKWQAAARRAA